MSQIVSYEKQMLPNRTGYEFPFSVFDVTWFLNITGFKMQIHNSFSRGQTPWTLYLRFLMFDESWAG